MFILYRIQTLIFIPGLSQSQEIGVVEMSCVKTEYLDANVQNDTRTEQSKIQKEIQGINISFIIYVELRLPR